MVKLFSSLDDLQHMADLMQRAQVSTGVIGKKTEVMVAVGDFYGEGTFQQSG